MSHLPGIARRRESPQTGAMPVECPRIISTDLDGLWLLAGFGDDGRRGRAGVGVGLRGGYPVPGHAANGVSNDVSVIDAETHKVIASIPVGKMPLGIAVSR